MFATCRSAVWTLIVNVAAISLFDRPAASRSTTVSSRELSPTHAPAAEAPAARMTGGGPNGPAPHSRCSRSAVAS